MSFPVHESITPQVEKLILIIGGEMTRQELQDSLNLSDRMNFLRTYLQPAIESGVLEMTIPDKPKSCDQQYRLTNAGKE
jgi:ATP-dependent DNA helicase RecG